LENIQEKNCALYSLGSGFSNEMLLDISLHLKEGWLSTSGNRYIETICAKMWSSKNKKLTCFGIFIPVKVSTLYVIGVTFVLCFTQFYDEKKIVEKQRGGVERK
jgi:hypothetical protein